MPEAKLCKALSHIERNIWKGGTAPLRSRKWHVAEFVFEVNIETRHYSKVYESTYESCVSLKLV